LANDLRMVAQRGPADARKLRSGCFFVLHGD
jgi:hypothetical protein